MQAFNVPTLYWWLTSRAQYLGAWGLLGLVLTVASLLFYQVKVSPLAPQIQQTQAALGLAKSQHPPISQQTPPPVENTAQQLASFYTRFPHAEQLPEALALMNKLAQQKRLALNSGDYKLTQLKQNKIASAHALTQYEIVLPVTGTYPQIRSYLDEVLYQLPALALTDLQLLRESSVEASVEAKLIFVLFVKGKSWQGESWQGESLKVAP